MYLKLARGMSHSGFIHPVAVEELRLETTSCNVRIPKPDSPSEPHDDLRRTAKLGRAEAGAPKTAALHDTPPRSRPAGTVTSPASEITFPKFDPIADDPDDRPVGASRDALGNIPERAGAVRGRTRTPRRRLVPVLLLAVVLLQVWPSYIWLRNHLNRRSASQATPAAAPMASAGADEGPPPGGSAPTATTGASNVPGPVAGEAALSPRTAPPSSAATTGTLPAPATPRREAARDGLISLVAPVPAQVFADGKPIGTMERGVIKLPVGRHNLEFVNDEVGYRASQSITVTPSRTAQVRLAAPSRDAQHQRGALGRGLDRQLPVRPDAHRKCPGADRPPGSRPSSSGLR